MRLEQALARTVSQKLGADVDPERVPGEAAYVRLAEMLDVSLHVHMFLGDSFACARFNAGAPIVADVLYTTVGQGSLRQGSGHFDFLADQMLWEEEAQASVSEMHSGCGR